MNHPTGDVQAAKLRQPAAASASEAGERGRGADRGQARESGGTGERGGDPACWLRRVCQQCGSMADADPPTICPACHAAMPGE